MKHTKFLFLSLLLLICVVRVSAQNNYYENYVRATLSEKDKALVEQSDANGFFVLPPARHGGPLYVTYSKLERRRGNRCILTSACDSLDDRANILPLTFTFIDEKNDTTIIVRSRMGRQTDEFRKIKEEGEKFTIIVSSPNYKTRVFKEVLLVDNFALSARLIPKDYEEITK